MRTVRTIASKHVAQVLTALREAMEGGPALYIAKTDSLGAAVRHPKLPKEVADHVPLILESSGSTGYPKLVQLGMAALIASLEANKERLGGNGQWLLALPVDHIAGAQVLLRSIWAETESVVMDPTKSFTPEAFLKASLQLTHVRRFVSLVPTQLRRLLKAGETNHEYIAALAGFEAVLVGGEKVDWGMVQQLRLDGVNVVTSYGMTETAGGCVYNGVPLDGVRIDIDNQRIVISGPMLAEGLQPSYRTADIGEFQDGKLEVLGRANRVINSGGLKVSLDRVEEIVNAMPGAINSIAVPLFSADWGERVGVYVQTELDEFDPTPTLLATIGPQARPLEFRHGSDSLLMSNGKPDYRAVTSLLTGVPMPPTPESNMFRESMDDEDWEPDDFS